MSDIPISKMNDRQLRNAVQVLYDNFALFKRKYEDMIYNLDSDNFSTSFTIAQDNMKTQVKAVAGAIKTMVSEADLRAELEKYSKVEQTANAITTTVTAEYVNNLISEDYVSNSVFETEVQQTHTAISQTADNVASIVSKNIAAYFTATMYPTASNTNAEEQSMLCLYNGSYYYYNDIKKLWEPYPANGIKSMFRQTPSGFELTGDVSVSGDMISGGSIKGLNVSTSESVFGDAVRLNSENNSLETLYNGAVVGSFGVTNGGSTLQPIGGADLFIYNVKARGTWDFSECEIIWKGN